MCRDESGRYDATGDDAEDHVYTVYATVTVRIGARSMSEIDAGMVCDNIDPSCITIDDIVRSD